MDWVFFCISPDSTIFCFCVVLIFLVSSFCDPFPGGPPILFVYVVIAIDLCFPRSLSRTVESTRASLASNHPTNNNTGHPTWSGTDRNQNEKRQQALRWIDLYLSLNGDPTGPSIVVRTPRPLSFASSNTQRIPSRVPWPLAFLDFLFLHSNTVFCSGKFFVGQNAIHARPRPHFQDQAACAFD